MKSAGYVKAQPGAILHEFAESPRTAIYPLSFARRGHRLRAGLKRAFDFTCALGALTLLAPWLLVIAVAVKLDSRGPVFHRVRRVGYRGDPFMMLKFRKMHHNAAGIPLTADADARLTRVGGFLTRMRLDELPQLWDVVCGRMSIVGPRPEDPLFVAVHSQEFHRILAVRPGITGLSQLAFADERKILDPDSPVEDYVARILPQKVRLDILYATRRTMRLDLSVLRWTIAAVLLHKPVAVNRANGALTTRRRSQLTAVSDLPSQPQAIEQLVAVEQVADAA